MTDALSYTGAVQNGRVRCAKGKDSLLVEFYFDEPGFMIPVQYILKESSVQIRINPKNISENENRVVSGVGRTVLLLGRKRQSRHIPFCTIGQRGADTPCYLISAGNAVFFAGLRIRQDDRSNFKAD